MANRPTRTIQRKIQIETRHGTMGCDHHNYNMARIPKPMGVKKRRSTRKRFNSTKRKRTRNIAKKNTETIQKHATI